VPTRPLYRDNAHGLGACGESLALDDVVDLEHLRRAEEPDPSILEHRHQPLPEGVELLLGIPDLGDAQVPLGAESDVGGQSLRWPLAGLLKPADAFVALLGGHVGRGGEADKLTRFVMLRVAASGLVVAMTASFVWTLPTEPTYKRALPWRSPGEWRI
jgi:hypothetical protein